jgi:hypothetical protein
MTPQTAQPNGPAAPSTGTLNRVIWTLWFQGFESAPEVVHLCARVWRARNPGWTLIQLSDENLADYIDPDELAELRALNLPTQKLANLIRMYLISRHGGVWSDATCFCCRPLDSWLPDYMTSGFFAYRFAADDWLRKYGSSPLRALTGRSDHRIMSNWFMVAVKGNALATTFYEEHRDFFQRHTFPLQYGPTYRERMLKFASVLNRNARLSQLWTTPLVIRLARLYPYFIFHYHFARLIRENAVCHDIWDRTPTLLNTGALSLRPRLQRPVTSELKRELEQPEEPLYKLTWRYRPEDIEPGSGWDYLLHSAPDDIGVGAPLHSPLSGRRAE